MKYFNLDLVKQDRNIRIFLFVFGFLLYGNSISNSYGLDDELVTIKHRNTSRGIKGIPDIIKQNYYEDQSGYKYEYRPVVHISFAIEHQFFGENPAISHAINAILYGLLCMILFWFLRSLLPSNAIGLALFSSLFFLVHPVHTEVVDSIKNRDELLSLGFALLSSAFLLRFVVFRLNFALLLISIALYGLSILSKISIVPFLISLNIGIVLLKDVSTKNALYFLFPVSAFGILVLPLGIFIKIGLVIAIFLVFLFLAFFKNRKDFDSWVSILLNSANTKSDSKEYWRQFTFGIKKLPFQDLLLFSLNLINIYFFILLYCTYFDIRLLTIMSFLPVASILFSNNKLLFSFLLFVYINFNVFLGYFYGDQMFAFLVGFAFMFIVSNSVLINVILVFYVYIINFIFSVFVFKLEFEYVRNLVDVSPFFIVSFILIYVAKLRNDKYIVNLFVLTNALFVFSFFNFFISISMLFFYGFFVLKNLGKLPFFVSRTGKIVLVVFILGFGLSIFLNSKVILIYNNPAYKVSLTGPINGNMRKVDSNLSKDSNQALRPIEFVECPVQPSDPLEIRIGTGMVVFKNYLIKLFFGQPLGFYYGYSFLRPTSLFSVTSLVLLGILLLCLIIGVFFLLKRNYILAFGLISFLLSLVPVLSIFYPIPGMMGDRFLFLPSFGFSLLFSSVFISQKEDRRSMFLPLVFGIICLVFAGLTYSRNKLWKDQVTLMRNDIDYLNQSAQAHNLLGINLMKASFEKDNLNSSGLLRKEAISHFNKAIEIYPEFFNVWFDLGRAYIEVNEPDRALLCFQKVVKMDSSYFPASLFVANILFNKNEFLASEQQFKKLNKSFPGMIEPYLGLGYLYYKQGNWKEAILVYDKAISFNPNWVEPYNNAIQIYLEKGDTMSALNYRNRLPK